MKANIIDIKNRQIYPAIIEIENTKIKSITPTNEKLDTYILPGFIDSHIHIESSMLVPSEFAKIAVKHGMVATVSDPHEIANVLGIKGVEFMIENGKKSGFKFYFGASPCVPATPFETSGAILTPEDIYKLLKRDDIYYLSEVMNFPGVINNDIDMLSKISYAKKLHKPIDGHCPGLRGEDLTKYISAGIQTDHESFSLEEAKEKLEKGMKIQIREGSAAKNYEALHPLIDEYYENMMFCSDDRHPNDLVKGDIDLIVKRAIKDGHDMFKVLQMACINPVKHYNLDVGLLQIGDNADFIEVDENFNILKTFINGKCVYDGDVYLDNVEVEIINNFNAKEKQQDEFQFLEKENYHIIDAIDHELITKEEFKHLEKIPNITEDILIISVINRYKNTKPSVSLVKGFGLKKGAIASSIAHDSHNIIAVGCDFDNITKAVNKIIKNKGGVCAINEDEVKFLSLEIAGLMSKRDGNEVAKEYEEVEKFVKNELKSSLDAPFMTLSFMALLVIPEIKLSDKGLFDANKFEFIVKE
jgi:adenine deaminase